MKKFLILITLASHLNSANYIYPEKHNWIKFTKEELGQLATCSFSTHHHQIYHALHLWNEHVIFAPFWILIHAQAYFVQPFPGKGKEACFWHLACRKIAAFAVGIYSVIPGIQSLLLGMTIRMLEHHDRPHISYLQRGDSTTIALQKTNPLHLCTFNVSFTPSSVNIKMDLRDPVDRAHELADAILNDPTPPNILVIEEGWNEKALEVFVTRLSALYPHILYHVAPQIVGMSSGIALFSQHEIEEVKFTRLEKMPLFHNLPSRGILCLSFKTEKGPLKIYGGIHTQSMTDYKSVQARKHQFAQLHACVEEDRKNEPGVHQIIMGDMNTTSIDMYGHDNRTQPEGEAWALLHTLFDDPFLEDHDPLMGVRTKRSARFLQNDNLRLGVELPEPTASWYDGPFLQEPEKSAALSYLGRETLSHGYPQPKIVKELAKVVWGTKEWFALQSANCARFDYILLPKETELRGEVEIRRIIVPKSCESPPSDHLPVHGLFWIEYTPSTGKSWGLARSRPQFEPT